jgi:branched-chain amino acid transport system permease protein
MFNLVTGTLPMRRGGALSGAGHRGLPQRQVARRGVARTFQHVKLRPT